MVTHLLYSCSQHIPRERTTYLFSATMTSKVQKLQRASLINPVRVEASTKYATVDTLKQQVRRQRSVSCHVCFESLASLLHCLDVSCHGCNRSGGASRFEWWLEVDVRVAGAVQYAFVPAKYKDCYLVYLLNELSGLHSIVFLSTCQNTQRVTLMLRNLGFSVTCLHGQMDQVGA